MKLALSVKTDHVTRPREQAAELRALLEERGADVLVQPSIAILPPETWDDVDDALQNAERRGFDWILFSSSNGVRFFFERVAPERRARFFADARVSVAAVGPGTAAALNEFGVAVDLIPTKEFNAEGLVAALRDAETSLDGKRLLSVRASRGRDVLSKEAAKLGAVVREVAAYRSVDVETPDAEIAAALRSNRIDFGTVASSATAKALARLFGDALAQTRWVALSPLTADALRSVGVEPAAVAEEATLKSLVDAVVGASQQNLGQ
ncbi:MAG: uroporphyrinogen-III synthase [Thermoguttaceae bacterium]|nr:uroporphyrinogen-III synthase [Thermoguttaceae bacterium]